MSFDRDIHHRHSIRLRGYDYACAGVYFVTMCTRDRECLFGDVVDGEMRLNAAGLVVESCLSGIPAHFKHVELDEYVVMPNHVHVILCIVGAKQDSSASPGYGRAIQDQGEAGKAFASPLPNGTISGSLGAVIQNFKPVSTRRINQIRRIPGLPVWQRNYYERVVRDDNEWHAIREYIADNPQQWALDKNNPVNMKAPVGAKQDSSASPGCDYDNR